MHSWRSFPTSQRYSNVQMSLNAGLVTFVNYGSDVSRATSIITFAHELGHNMGSTVRRAAATYTIMSSTSAFSACN